MKTIQQLINEYQEYSLVTKSENTCRYQIHQIKALNRFFVYKKIQFIEEISKETIDDLVIWSRKTCRNITINKRITFFKQVIRYHEIDLPYLLKFPKLKQEKKSFDVIYEDDLKILLNFVDQMNENDPYQLTRKLIVFFLLDTGVRANEMLNVKIKNIDFRQDQIKLETTKTDVERYVFFTRMTKSLLQKYIAFYPDREYLFWNYISFKKFTYRNLEAYCNYLQKELDLRKLHPHMFRHTMATALVESGCPIETVQKILGHEDISSTLIYVHISLKKAHMDFDKYAILIKKRE